MIYNTNNEVICDYNCLNCESKSYCTDKIIDDEDKIVDDLKE